MNREPGPGLSVPLALQRVVPKDDVPMRVGSPSIHGAIPRTQSAYAEGRSPQISWNRVEGAKSYALILEDPDAKNPRPFVHWLAYNIPGERTSLPEGLRGELKLSDPAELFQGRNSRGAVGYFGPRPPAGDPAHHYHFQVFALDTELSLPPGVQRDEIIVAMSNHVLAAGELVGTYQQDSAAE
jgi:Raf kinase inhibitor-like YbhB/YbcL family protein